MVPGWLVWRLYKPKSEVQEKKITLPVASKYLENN